MFNCRRTVGNAHRLGLVGVMILVGWWGGVVVGQTPLVFEDEHLFASNGSGGDVFGGSVSVSGNVAVVGAHLSDTTGLGVSGSVYVYRFDGSVWGEEAELISSMGAIGDFFGISVSIGGTPGNEVIVVGAEGDDTAGGLNAGSAYVYRFNGTGWEEEGHLFASDGVAGDLFGHSVSIGGTFGSEVAIVGSRVDDTAGGMDAGSAYVYRFDGAAWIEEAHLTASDGEAFDGFGTSVSISGILGNEVAFVGAPTDDTASGVNAGSGYVFRFNGTSWIEEDHLFATTGAGTHYYGQSVSVSGGLAILGASNSTFIYRLSGANWVEEATLFAVGGGVASSVSISDSGGGEIAVVGAQTSNTTDGGLARAVFVYRRFGTNWVEIAHLLASDGALQDQFGRSVSVGGDIALVGAWHDNTAGGSFAGSAYVYSFSTDCNGNGIGDLMDIATGFSLDCNGNGVPDECELKGNDGNGNGVPDECDPDCNGNGIPDFLEILSGEIPDCNGNGVPDECDVVSGFSLDCNGNGIPDICDVESASSLDCNGNGVPDECDTKSGSSFDCNLNSIPDECELEGNDMNGNGIPDECDLDCNGNGMNDLMDIASGISMDCNGNGIPDECDVVSGVSADCNGNLVPDSCEVASLGPFQVGKLLASDGVANDKFGAVFALEGDMLVVGGQSSTLASYVYQFNGVEWMEVQRLMPSMGELYFSEISLDGNLLILGAPLADDLGTQTGSAYIYRHNGIEWIEEVRLTASDGKAFDTFGISVEIEGDTAIVGAWEADGVVANKGAVYIFSFDGSNWLETQKIFASDGGTSSYSAEHFGFYTAIQDDVIVVSGDLNDGKTYVFRHQNSIWGEEAILIPLVDEALSLRGGDVAIEGEVIVSGNVVTSGESDHVGNIYRFDGTVWDEEAVLRAEDIDAFGRSVYSVDLENGFVLLGTAKLCCETDTIGLSVYGYRFDGVAWITLPKILAVEKPQRSIIPNYNVGLSGDRAMVGTFVDDTQGEDAGAVFLFEGVRGSDCNGNKIPDGCDIASGLSVDIDGNGVPDSCQGVVCVADIAVPHNGEVDLLDLIAVLDGFGDCPVTGVCPADITPLGGGNGVVNIDDLVAVLNGFGGCP